MGRSVLPRATVSRRQQQAGIDSEPLRQVQEGGQRWQRLARLDLRDEGTGIGIAELGLGQPAGEPDSADPLTQVEGQLSSASAGLFSHT